MVCKFTDFIHKTQNFSSGMSGVMLLAFTMQFIILVILNVHYTKLRKKLKFQKLYLP